MKKIILILLTLGFAQLLSAQKAEEAFLYANTDFSGTARSSAMGGAFSSLGGDISVAHTNPAGLAIFRNSTASITPGLLTNKQSRQDASGDKTSFILPSVGAVFALEGNQSVKNWSFGLTYSQSANYKGSLNFNHANSTYSFLDDIAEDANYDINDNFNPYEENSLANYGDNDNIDINFMRAAMAYNTYLISPTGDNDSYQSPLFKDDLLNRTSKISTKGNSGEFALSVAGNVNDFFYFGATLGIQNIDYKSTENYYEETANVSNATELDNFYYDSYIKTTGAGANLKLGIILRPTNQLRLGIAAHTPTFYALEDEFHYVMESNFFTKPEGAKETNFYQVYPTDNKEGLFNYNYTTPWKFTFGGSYILGKMGLLSIDYDLIDYSSSKFSDGDGNGNFDGVNQEIKDTYKMTGNLKLGAEVRLDEQFALRAGYNHFGNAYDKNSGIEQTASRYSTGLGYRLRNMFLDASYQFYTQEVTGNNNYKRNLDVNTVKLTFGWKF